MFSTPPAEDSPPHSPSVGNDNEEGEDVDIPMVSPTHSNKELEDFSTGDAPPQDHNGTGLQMDLNDHPNVQHSPKIIQIKELDDEPIHQQTEETTRETAEANVVQPIEPPIDESVQALVERTVEVTIEQDFEAARIEAEPGDINEKQNVEENRYEAKKDVEA